MKKAVVIIIIVVLIVGIAVSLGFFLKKRSTGAVEIQSEMVIRRDISQIVTAFGRINPEVEINISTKVIGQIEKIYITEGDTVAKGDSLVRLERTRYVASLNSARASLRSAMAQVDRVQLNLNQAKDAYRKAQSMFEKGLLSEDALEKSKVQVDLLEAELASTRDGVERAQAMLDEAQDNLDQTIMLAPVAGIIVKLYAEAGENVITGTTNVPGSTIMTLAQLEVMEAVVSVDEADVVDLQIGQEAKIEVDAFPDTFLVGTVVKIANQATLQNVGGQETVANFEVKIAVVEPFERIRPGMSCSAEIEVSKADSVVAVPIQAVVLARPALGEKTEEAQATEKSGAFAKPKEAVFIIEDGIARQKIVETGIADDRYIEIKDGLAGGEKVVIGRYKALRELKDGDKVKESDPERGKGGFDVRVN